MEKNKYGIEKYDYPRLNDNYINRYRHMNIILTQRVIYHNTFGIRIRKKIYGKE